MLIMNKDLIFFVQSIEQKNLHLTAFFAIAGFGFVFHSVFNLKISYYFYV
jgi:hypothetical protein